MKLTTHLLSLDKEAYEKATRHHFLHQVGTHAILPRHLQSWIEQDRAYTNGYTKMMGLLISRIALIPDQREWGDNDPHYDADHSHTILKTLSFAVSNVFREYDMFSDILSRYDGPLGGMKPWTRRYVDFLQKVARTAGYDLGEALVVLWAMEKVFLEAWLYAASLQPQKKPGESVHEETMRQLCLNWTSTEFQAFVNQCAGLVDALATSDPLRMKSFELVYRETLALEVKFWDMAFTDVELD
ncbi:hypothetical protein BC941DRAFT_439830 [Chlamydoabsidia padenii]|nr:hypothetical protein BC941DRAFT_439830 [Chlamydoabsidia padenii]